MTIFFSRFLLAQWLRCAAPLWLFRPRYWLGSAILVAASATVAMSSLETGAKFRWRSSGKKWCNMFLVSDGQPELGSWLDVKQQPWGVGCKVCKETGVSNPFASYSMTKKGQLQNCNLMKHHKSKGRGLCWS